MEKAKLLALFQFTCRGIPFTYFGDEIGIPRVRIPLKQGKDAIAIQHSWVPQFLVDRERRNSQPRRVPHPYAMERKTECGFLCRFSSTVAASSGKFQGNKCREANG